MGIGTTRFLTCAQASSLQPFMPKIEIEIHHHFVGEPDPKWLPALKALINQTGKQIMTKVDDAVQVATDSLNAALTDINDDITALTAKVAELKDELANGNISAEAQAKLDAVVAAAQALASRTDSANV